MTLYLIRHGETAWSLSGQHTGRTDVPLTSKGEEEARRLARGIRYLQFTHVFTSPRLRARRTCELAGLDRPPEVDPELAEWDYGEYEGLRSVEIRKQRPDWNIFRDGCPGGESPSDISARADRVIARFRALEGEVLVFSHGHFGRVLAARWIDLPLEHAQRFLLSTASISVLGHEGSPDRQPAIVSWNDVAHHRETTREL
jgi:probable phosphoglycerate mutase